ncbi:MAG: hypothetical protein ABSB38_01050 [Dehalococcoidia bacterium]|jgi:hypothetical protein
MVDSVLQGLLLGASYLIDVAIYVWSALCLYIIAKKTGTPNPWLAWIPIANIYLMCKVAGKPGWWIVFFCITIVLAIPMSIASVMVMFLAMGGGEIPAWFTPLVIATIVSGLISWVLLIIIWMAIAKARHKPSWLGILMIVPIANLVIPGVLAFSDNRNTN